MHDLVDLVIQLPEGDYVTVARLRLNRLGHQLVADETLLSCPVDQPAELLPSAPSRSLSAASKANIGHA